jgi:cytochrome c-type biogenesis protein CcmH
MLWISFAIMLLAAAVFVALPLYKNTGGKHVPVVVSSLFIIAFSAGLYHQIGSPGVQSGAGTSTSPGMGAGNDNMPPVEDMVTSLEERLLNEPDDLNGWQMLGRSHMNLGNFPEAIAAFEKAVELEDGNNGETLISLGEAVLSNDQTSIGGRAGQLFESGLALVPNSSRGLFYGGFSALQRNDQLLAADRWETLLNSGPPPEIREVLERRIIEWRGGDPELAVVAPGVIPEATPEAIPGAISDATEPATAGPTSGTEITVSFSDAANAAVRPSDSVFVIARDPERPSPPIAAVRRTVADMNAPVMITDANAMIAGRVPSGFEVLEIIVRVSRSGEPIARSGDWFGQNLIKPKKADTVAVTIDQQVP